MFYKFKLGFNDAVATKIICCTKVKGAVDYVTVIYKGEQQQSWWIKIKYASFLVFSSLPEFKNL